MNLILLFESNARFISRLRVW